MMQRMQNTLKSAPKTKEDAVPEEEINNNDQYMSVVSGNTSRHESMTSSRQTVGVSVRQDRTLKQTPSFKLAGAVFHLKTVQLT